MSGLDIGASATVTISATEGAAMQIETIGKYQLHLIAHELPGSRGWDPFVEILKFDDDAGDFKCVLEKHHAADQGLPSYEEAIDRARRVGNAFIEKDTL